MNARLFRISYSGELAYEIAVPAGHTVAVWEALLAAGREVGLAPYGTEAMAALRIEKGHVAGAEKGVGAWRHDDLVLTVRGDGDESRPGGSARGVAPAAISSRCAALRHSPTTCA